jgi:hypothetical protein
VKVEMCISAKNGQRQELNEIKRIAEECEITLDTDIRINRVIEEYLTPNQPWLKWLCKRQMKKYPNNPQAGHYLVIETQQWQAIFAGLQALTFLAFLGFGLYFAASI